MRGKLISAIHVAKRELALDDETYTSALLAATGKTSCRDMSPDELSRVLDVFKKRGFKVRQNPVNRALKPGTVTAKIRAIWKVMHRQGFITDGAETALNRWVKSQTAAQNGGEGVANWQWLEQPPALASDVLERLKRWHRRKMLAAMGMPERTLMGYDAVCRQYEKSLPR
ncbi:gp16 family protein [Escherichia coli]|nr:gp16 family protein [Escherichia coli]